MLAHSVPGRTLLCALLALAAAPAAGAQVLFTNVASSAGVGGQPYFSLTSHGLGAACIDVNRDGWPDLFCVNGKGSPSHFYLNQGNGTFALRDDLLPPLPDVEKQGAIFADYDNDGDFDLFVANYGPNALYRNEGGRFDEVASAAIPAPDDLASRLRALAWALLSAEQVGGAQRALDLTVEYTKSRKQFGRTIGSFQALKHRMANMYVLVETARSISRAAVAALAADDPDADDLALAAHVYCSDAYRRVAGEAIQLHGGIGITWEHDIQLYFKRAQATSQMLGAPHTAVTEAARALR